MSRRLPDISVVISTYQRRECLRRAVDSLVAQRVPPDLTYEIVLVDNNSSDGTRDVIAEYVRQYPAFVRFATEPRQGVSRGRNAGIRASRGAIIAFTDDDNVAPRTWVATIASQMRQHPGVDGVGGKVLPEWPRIPPGWLDRKHWSPLAILDYGERPFLTSARRPLCLLTANLAIRREALERLGGFSPDFHRCQDHELLLRLWRAGGHVLYAPELVTFAPVDPRRMTRRYHLLWHARHGRYAARMRLEEATDEHGRLRALPPTAPSILGSPGYVYADAVQQGWRWLTAAVRRRRARALLHEHRFRYLLAYLQQTAMLTRSARPPLLREATTFVREHLRRRARVVQMSPARLVTVQALVALIVGASAFDIVTGQEHWPFSPYPMFSSVESSRTLDSLLLVGVPADPGAGEFPLRAGAFIAPFDQCRLNTALLRARSAHDDGARLHAMLEDSFSRYEDQRRRGAHDGPPLRAVRVYDAHWELAPDAGNANTPERTRLLDEVVASPLPIAQAGH